MASTSGERRVAIVTGGTKGLGRGITERLLSDGLRVAAFARDVEWAGRKHDGSLMLLKVDVTSPNQVRRGVEEVVASFGRLDVLVNNAGVSGPIKKVQDISLEEWNRTITVNLTGAFVCCKFAIPYIAKSGSSGRVVNISSMGWKKASAFRSPYAASKAGLLGLTRALSRELGRSGGTVNAVSPGPIEGRRMEEVGKGTAAANGGTPKEFRERLLGASSLHRFSTASEVAALVSFLVSDEAGSVTGQDFSVDST